MIKKPEDYTAEQIQVLEGLELGFEIGRAHV